MTYEEVFSLHSDVDASRDCHDAIVAAGGCWTPWIGRNRSFGQTLIVGESHYYSRPGETASDWTDEPDSTRQVVSEYFLDGSAAWGKHNKTFDNAYRIIFGKSPDEFSASERARIFDGIAYANIVQRPMKWTDGDREIATPLDFKDGWKALVSVLPIIKPKRIIFLGVTAANHFYWAKNDFGFSGEVSRDDELIGGAYGRYGTVESIPMVFVKHPGKVAGCAQCALWRQYVERRVGRTLYQ